MKSMFVFTCPFCGHRTMKAIEESDVARLQTGEDIDDVMPYLAPRDKELILTQICYACQGNDNFYEEV